ncbi:MAG: hypothetical protein LBD63_00610 [Mycoplasmataceae bacterium]|nr:hypothetical protein [Mycoplasmataceae bacterium]
MEEHRKLKLIRFGLPIAIVLALIVGVLSFPDIVGAHSPYVSLASIYFFEDWSVVNTSGYVTLFALIQFFIIAFILGILIFKFTNRESHRQKQSSLFLMISMSVFIFTVILFTIWLTTGLFDDFLADSIIGNKVNMISLVIDYTISYACPSLILAFALISLIFWFIYYIPSLKLPIKKRKFSYRVFDGKKIPWTGKDLQLKIICSIGLFVAAWQIILTTISVYNNKEEIAIYPHMWEKIWFGTMHHFTELSNLWVLIFFITFLLNYRFHFLKTSAFVTMTFTYITVTFLIADFLLAPFMILNHSSGMINMGFGGGSNWHEWVKTILYHVVQPIVMLIFFIFFCKSTRQYRPWKFDQIIPVTMIFPTLYLIYAIVINFLPIEHLQINAPGEQPVTVYGGISVYGYFTCINPSVHASVFSNNKPIWHGTMTNIIWYVFAICLFLGLAFYYNWVERHNMILKYLRAHKLYSNNYKYSFVHN